MKNWTVDDWLVVLAGIVLVLLLVWIIFFLSGCASKQSKYQLRYLNGCLVEMQVATADEAGEISKDFDITDCEYKTEIEDEK